MQYLPIALLLICLTNVYELHQDVDFAMNDCYKIGDNLILNVTYKGNESVYGVEYYYSKKQQPMGQNLIIEEKKCNRNGFAPDPGFNMSRMFFKCPSAFNISKFQVTIADLDKSEIGQEWGANIVLYSGLTRSGMQKKKIIECISPQTPVNLQSSNVTETTADLTWTPGYDGGKPQTYVIQYKLSNANSWQTVAFAGPPPYQLKHLQKCESYLVQIFADNTIGHTSLTPAINFTTTGKLQDVDFAMNDCYSVGDDLILNVTYNGCENVYGVEYYYSKKIQNGNNLVIKADTCSKNGHDADKVFSMFSMDFKCPSSFNITKFQVTIAGLNRSEIGQEWGAHILRFVNTTRSGMQKKKINECKPPHAPLNLQSSNVTETSADLSWTPGYDGGKPQTFVIQYKLSNANSWQTVAFAGPPPYQLKHLQKCESYLVQIFANNTIGPSSSTHAINFTTTGKVYNVDFAMDDCYNVGDDLILNVTFNGCKNVYGVEYYYSKKIQNGNNLVIKADTCNRDRLPPDRVFNMSRLDFKCPASFNITKFQVTIAGLDKSEIGQEWGADILLYNGLTKSGIKKKKIIECKLPDVPLNLQASNVDETSANFIWTPGYDGGKPQIYVIQYKLYNANNWQTVDFAGPPPYKLDHLRNCESYLVQIFAKNTFGHSSLTPAINFTTTGANRNICKPADGIPYLLKLWLFGVSLALVIFGLLAWIMKYGSNHPIHISQYQYIGNNTPEEHSLGTRQAGKNQQKNNANDLIMNPDKTVQKGKNGTTSQTNGKAVSSRVDV